MKNLCALKAFGVAALVMLAIPASAAEVVDRIVASVGSSHYGRLSVMMQYYFRTEGLLVVPPDVFDPPPNGAFLRGR